MERKTKKILNLALGSIATILPISIVSYSCKLEKINDEEQQNFKEKYDKKIKEIENSNEWQKNDYYKQLIADAKKLISPSNKKIDWIKEFDILLSKTKKLTKIAKPNNQNNTNNDKFNISNFHEAKFNFEILKNNKFEVGKATEINIARIADGDTISDSYRNKYRFNGIDTPETHKKINGNFEETSGIQYKYGKIAENYTKNFLNNAAKIWVVPQETKSRFNTSSENFYDYYKRIVAIIYYQDKITKKIYNLNEQLVFFGMARMHYISIDPQSNYYTKNIDYYKQLQEASNHAKNLKLGIFDSGNDINKIYPQRSRKN
ncbi:thermonuclease family protein [Metamycoplasma hominis]|uniref:thermonuclease family protein n=1 Tax=Metamycoplasma hominis TaxID=2098 RepID=UPI0005C83112|nr:thermonuclease family protein [Metamycoplasma hominis]